MNAKELLDMAGKNIEYDEWGFGDDNLLDLVLKEKKKATSSLYLLYEKEGEELPSRGNYSVLLDNNGNARCLIVTTNVIVLPFNEITADLAKLEGEGDLSLKYWQDVHTKFFQEELDEYNMKFDNSMKVVFEEFELIVKA